jgi:hypothetical protein
MDSVAGQAVLIRELDALECRRLRPLVHRKRGRFCGRFDPRPLTVAHALIARVEPSCAAGSRAGSRSSAALCSEGARVQLRMTFPTRGTRKLVVDGRRFLWHLSTMDADYGTVMATIAAADGSGVLHYWSESGFPSPREAAAIVRFALSAR